MNASGIFSILLLIASITLIGTLHFFGQNNLTGIQKSQTTLLALEKANFIRTNLEIEFDKIIQSALQEGIKQNNDAEQTSIQMNQNILEAIQLIEAENKNISFFLQQSNNKIKVDQTNLLENFSIVFIPFSKQNMAAIFTYHGGKNRNWKLIGEIQVNDVRQQFEIPIGYTQCILKSWEEFNC